MASVDRRRGAPRLAGRLLDPAGQVVETWAELVPLAPPEVRVWLLDFEWDPARLHALDLPVEHLPVAELSWMLELPF